MGFKSWLTGRSEIYADEDKVNGLVTEIEAVRTGDLEKVRDDIASAVRDLNACTGFQEYVSNSLSADSFDTIVDAAGDTIDKLVSVINGNMEDIKAYSEAGTGKRILATGLMGLAKFGEGVLSVGEELGDGVVSIVGWLAPKDSGLEKWCTKAVEKKVAHGIFNKLYYQTKLSKASYFTEDSALAGACLIGGKAYGYLWAGGFLSETKLAGLVGKTKLAKKIVNLKIASNSTWAATAVAAVGGAGVGTEIGLDKGYSINKAFGKEGLKYAGIQGGLAFLGGKAGERSSRSALIKEQDDIIKSSEAEIRKITGNETTESVDDIIKFTEEEAKFSGASGEVAKVEKMKPLIEKRAGAIAERERLNGTKLADYEGYTDSATRSGQNAAKKLNSKTNNLFKRKGAGTVAAENVDDAAAKATPETPPEGSAEPPANAEGTGTKATKGGKGTKATTSTEPTPVVSETGTEAGAATAAEGGPSVASGTGTAATKTTRKIGIFKKKPATTTASEVADGATADAKAAVGSGKRRLLGNGEPREPITNRGKIKATKAKLEEARVAETSANNEWRTAKGELKDSDVVLTRISDRLPDKVKSIVKGPREKVINFENAEQAAANAGKRVKDLEQELANLEAKTLKNRASAFVHTSPKEHLENLGKGIVETVTSPAAPGVAATVAYTTISEANKVSPLMPKIGENNPSTDDASADTSDTSSTSDTSTSDTSSNDNGTTNNDGGYNDYSNNGGGGGGYDTSGGDQYVPPSNQENTENTENTENNQNNENQESVEEVTPSEEENNNENTENNQNNENTENTENTENNENTQNNTEGNNNTSNQDPVVIHTGGGTSEGDGYVPAYSGDSYEPVVEPEPEPEPVVEPEEPTEDPEVLEPDDPIIESDPEINKIPVSPDTDTNKKSGSSVIPIAAGLSAAAAAGLGAKAYMDHKRNNSDEEDDEFEADSWDENEEVNDYYAGSSDSDTFDDDDEYLAHEPIVTEKYDARTNDELADLQ
ncbi:MAG: hypothetical protein IJI58_01790 [Bacilli bacterium]|nr:hypothetical protein [Bacilli bacterium]